MTHVTCRLTAKNRDQLRNPTLGNRVRATFTFVPLPDIGAHVLLQVIRAVLLNRPVHVYRFVADMLDVELAQRTFDDITQGCALKKSQGLEPYPSPSCQLMIDFLLQTKAEGDASDISRPYHHAKRKMRPIATKVARSV